MKYEVRRIGKIKYTETVYDISNLERVLSDGALKVLERDGYAVEVMRNGDVVEAYQVC